MMRQPARSSLFPYTTLFRSVNGDGRLDLAVAHYYSNDVSVLLGNGDGTFQAALSFAAGTNPVSVAVGDVNSDGRLDLAVASHGYNCCSVLSVNREATSQSTQ